MVDGVNLVFKLQGILLATYLFWRLDVLCVFEICCATSIVSFIKYFGDRKSSSSLYFLRVVPLLVICSTLIIFLLALALGAPLLSEAENTLSLSLLLSLLGVLPLLLATEANVGHLTALVLNTRECKSEFLPLVSNLYGSLFGAWLGAFVIPLDWDRPWQVWPLPCCLGALLFSSISHVVFPSLLTRLSHHYSTD